MASAALPPLAVKAAFWRRWGKADEGLAGSVQEMLIHSAGHPLAGFAGTRNALRHREHSLRTPPALAASARINTSPAM